MVTAIQPSLAFRALHPLMLYLLSMVRSHLLYNQQKNPGWVPDGDPKEEFPEMLQEY